MYTIGQEMCIRDRGRTVRASAARAVTAGTNDAATSAAARTAPSHGRNLDSSFKEPPLLMQKSRRRSCAELNMVGNPAAFSGNETLFWLGRDSQMPRRPPSRFYAGSIFHTSFDLLSAYWKTFGSGYGRPCRCIYSNRLKQMCIRDSPCTA